MDEYVYTKCLLCHLFVDENSSFEDSTPDMPIAEYVHLHRGDEHDEALDATHEAVPGGTTVPLGRWRKHGPYEMQARFDLADAEANL